MAKGLANTKGWLFGSKLRIAGFVSLFVVAGFALLMFTRAASPTANIQPEAGTISGPATVCTDTSASGGSCIKFAAAVAPEPTPACTRTISTGINSAISSMSNGQTLCVDSGTYSEAVTLNKSITLMATPGSTTKPKINSLFISVGSTAVLGFEITSNATPLVRIGTGTGTKIYNVTMKYNKIHTGPSNGVHTWANNLLFESNEMHTFANEDAIRIFGDNLRIRNNYIHDVQNSGHNDPFQTWVILGNSYGETPVTNLVMEDNIIRNFPGGHGHCFMASSFKPGFPHRDWKIMRNRFENIGSHCFIFSGVRENTSQGEPDIGVLNTEFYYNKFTNIGGYTIKCELQSSAKLHGNTFTAASTPENRNGQCTNVSAPTGVSSTRPAYDVTWPI